MGKRNEGHRHKYLDGPLQAAMLRALFPQAAFMPTQRSIYADVQLHSRHLHSNTRALVDSGATDNFISPALLLTIQYNEQDTKQKFYVANLGEDWMILGMPFLAAANPDIDWATGTFN